MVLFTDKDDENHLIASSPYCPFVGVPYWPWPCVPIWSVLFPTSIPKRLLQVAAKEEAEASVARAKSRIEFRPKAVPDGRQ